MKIPTVLLAVCTLGFAACAGTPKKECCSTSGSMKSCPAGDAKCKMHSDTAGKHKH